MTLPIVVPSRLCRCVGVVAATESGHAFRKQYRDGFRAERLAPACADKRSDPIPQIGLTRSCMKRNAYEAFVRLGTRQHWISNERQPGKTTRHRIRTILAADLDSS